MTELSARLLALGALAALTAPGCSTSSPGGIAEGEGEGEVGDPCGGQCQCHEVCNAASGACTPRECGAYPEGCATAPAEAPAPCGEGRICAAGLCATAQCGNDEECPRSADDHVQRCEQVDGRRECVPGCRNDDQCQRAEAGFNPFVCEADVGPLGTCRECDCRTDADCDAIASEGQRLACNKDGDCRCAPVECRPGRAECDEGFVCNARTFTCESESCRVHADCADPHKHCKRAPGEDRGRCVCGDDRTTDECELDDCRDVGQCRGGFSNGDPGFGPTFICLSWSCAEQPCNGDSDCSVLGTSCGPENKCIPTPCNGDAVCPRRLDIEPLPSGVFWCDDTGTCAPGCRDATDCPETHKCEDHACVPRVCRGAGECDRGRWCDPRAEDIPEDAGAGVGLCVAGCDEVEDCPVDQPCRLDVHRCGCAGDADCAIIDPDLICEDDGTCGPPCRGHGDCAGDEACVAGHCIEGACRNDRYEPNDVQDDAATLPLEADPGDRTRRIGRFDVRMCSEPPPRRDMPLDVTDWYVFDLRQYEELEIKVTWPLVDTDGDGFGDAPGACDLNRGDLSGLQLFRPAEDGPGNAREWPRPGWQFEPPGPNQPCIVTVSTFVPAPQAQAYRLSIENIAATVLDYRLDVVLRQSLDCRPDAWESNNRHQDARAIFECGQFLIDGGHLQAHTTIEGPTLCRGDGDWYRIDLRNGDRLSVVLTYDNRLGELRARLRPPGDQVNPDVQNLVLQDATGEGGVLELLETDEQDTIWDGEYLLQVTPGPLREGIPQGTPVETEYALHIACEGPQVPCQPEQWEPNDTQETAHCINQRGGGCPAIVDPRFVWQYPDPANPGAPPAHLCIEGAAPDGRDEDWYQFCVGAGGQVNALTENELGPAGVWFIELELQDAAGAVIRRSGNAGRLNSVNVNDLAGGCYFLRVKHPVNVLDDRTVPYSVNITVFGAAPECAEDPFEENDTLAAARPLPIEAQAEGDPFQCIPVGDEDADLALCAPPRNQAFDEEDWYRLNLNNVIAERLDVELRCTVGVDGDGQPAPGDDLFTELRVADGTDDGGLSCPRNVAPDLACRDLTPGCAEGRRPQAMSLQAPRATDHFVRVFGVNDAQNAYRLCVKLVADICEDDRYEQNDVCAQARPHNEVTSPFLNQFFPLEAHSCPTDDDYFVFRPSGAPGVRPAATYDIRVLVNVRGDADLDVQLLDKRCNRFVGVLQEDVSLAQQVCLVQHGARADDDFYVRVFGADALSEAGYDIKVDVGANNTLNCF